MKIKIIIVNNISDRKCNNNSLQKQISSKEITCAQMKTRH